MNSNHLHAPNLFTLELSKWHFRCELYWNDQCIEQIPDKTINTRQRFRLTRQLEIGCEKVFGRHDPFRHKKVRFSFNLISTHFLMHVSSLCFTLQCIASLDKWLCLSQTTNHGDYFQNDTHYETDDIWLNCPNSCLRLHSTFCVVLCTVQY